jgi:HEAT repeat protein
MTTLSLPLKVTSAVLLGLLLLAGCTTPATPPAAPAKPVAAEGAFDDDQHPLTANESAVIAAGLDPVKLGALERDLLAIMQKPGASPAEVQDAAQKLGAVVLTGTGVDHAATLAALAPLLTDPARVDYARLALDRVPGAEVDALYVHALASASGRARLGLIDSLASRHVTAAVPQLAALLSDPDRATAAAATRALGRIGGRAALDALAGAQDPLAPVVLNARLSAAAQTDGATAAQVAGEIHRNTATPLAQRAAALRALIAADPTSAVETIHAALSGPETAFHQVAIESVATLPVTDAGGLLAARLPAYPPAVQLALIAALGHRTGDASSVPGLLAALEGPSAAVRLAALDALGRLPGDAEVAHRLVALAAGRGEEAKAASAALARLDGPGLDDLIRAGAAAGDDALRAVCIQQLAARNLTDTIPFLLNLRTAPSENLRLEALDALRSIASTADLPPLVAWATGTADRNEANRAVRALVAIILRDGQVDTRAATVIRALESGDVSTRLTLLPVLSRAAGAPALATAGRLARDPDEAVAVAATGELVRWPDASALPALVDLAVATKSDAVRTAAVQGAARFLAQRTPAIAAGRSAQTRALLGLPLTPAARIALLNVLGLCKDREALETARKLTADAATGAAARDAAEAITSNLAGPPLLTVSTGEADAALMTDGQADTAWQVPANDPGTWIRADLHSPRPVRRIILEHGWRNWGYPGEFDVQVSDNADQPGEVIARGEGEKGTTTVGLPAGTRGRYVWIRLTSHRDAPLAIGEFIVE